MYNLRKKLIGITVIMFAAATALNAVPFFNSDDKETSAAPTDTSASVSQDAQNMQISDTSISDEHFVAHRGYSIAAPENSTVAFELAGKSKFWGIETDISQTYDDEFVCMHDDELDRTTDGTGAVGQYTYESLRELTIDTGSNIDMYQGLTIPSMTEYLAICAEYGCVPIIEIKSVTDYDKFLQTIYDNGFRDNCIITGGIEDLKEIRSRDADVVLMVIGYSNKDYTFYTELIKELSGTNNGILYNYPVVTADVVNEVHNAGLLCGVWSLDTEDEAKRFAEYGADFIVTNEIPASTNLMINTTE